MFTADNVRRRLVNLSGSSSDGLDKYIVKKYYKVDLTNKPTLGLLSRMLDIAPHVIVVESGKVHLMFTFSFKVFFNLIVKFVPWYYMPFTDPTNG